MSSPKQNLNAPPLLPIWVCQTLVQPLSHGPVTKQLAERWTTVVGIGCGCIPLVVMAFDNQDWIAFAFMLLFALAGTSPPAFQALATRQG